MRKNLRRKLLEGIFCSLFSGVWMRGVLPYHPKSSEKDFEGTESWIAMCLLGVHKRLVVDLLLEPKAEAAVEELTTARGGQGTEVEG